MRALSLTCCFTLISVVALAPPNCEIWRQNEICYEACELSMEAIRNPQGSYQSQVLFDEAIQKCPNFAYAYMEKGVPFLKRGQFIEWKKLIDKAVELYPEQYLGYRGWCKLQFLRDYEGAIADIEQLKALVSYDIGFCQTGDYHLNFALAFCYKELGFVDKAKQLMLEQIAQKGYMPGLYDYYHLGVLFYELGDLESAETYFNLQNQENDGLGETFYYLALIHQQQGQVGKFKEYIELAESKYTNGYFRVDTYTETFDKIYLEDIISIKE